MKVFIVDDDPGSRFLLSAALGQMGYKPEAFSTGEELLAEFPDDDICLLLLDWVLPGLDGMEVCRTIRAKAGGDNHYIILVSAREGSHEIREALESGASDYIIKGQDPGEMRARIGVGIRTVILENERAELNRKLKQMARVDSSTGLLNHSVILQELAVELNRGEREGSSTGVLILDIDHFKAVNDTYGHPVGDEVILRFAGMLRSSCRPYDRIGRYGGDEFLVILPRSDIEVCMAVAARLKAATAGIDFSDIVMGLAVTFSAGACASGNRIKYAGALVAAADTALYRAKAAGRDQILDCRG